jgi:hypothetical protein
MGSLNHARVPGLFRVCSGLREQPKPLNGKAFSALFRVFRVIRARHARAHAFFHARTHYIFFPRAQGGNTRNTWNALQPCGIPRSGYPEQTRNTAERPAHA